MNKNLIITIASPILIILAGFLILTTSRYNELKRECYKAYQYSDGIIYIGDNKCLEKIEKEDKDLLILDARSESNPDIKIYDSYKITKEEKQKEVLELLLKYEKLRPSKWDRTVNSMVNEWYAHNLLYNFGYQKNRTKDVDLDNNDENTYTEKFGIQTIIKYYSKKS